MNIHQIDLLIDGKNRPAADGKRFDLLSPATGEKVGSIAQAGSADVEAVMASAQAAFKTWSALTGYEREKIIRQATAHVRTKAKEIGLLMALEQGKPLAQSQSEITGSCDTIDYYAAEGVRIEGYTNMPEAKEYRSTVIYQPVGVCVLITPWNYPVSLLSWKLGPALAAGCPVVVKPTTVTPMSPTAFCQALIEGGIPAGVVSVLNGPGAQLGEALVRHPATAKIAMTGSTATGKRLMEIFAPSLRKISLELGGHCPAVVCEDADLAVAAKIIAYKGFRNMGQSCSSVNRVYAQKKVHDELVTKLKAVAEKMTIGDGVSDGSVDLGPMATKGGLETVKAHVKDALERGATLVCGGKAPEGDAYKKGYYYLPTILTNVPRDALVMREETFGPVVAFASFDKNEEAVALANDTEYGLVSYLFTKDLANTVKMSEALQAGTVCVNHGAVNTNYGPYAGWKDSGYGLELSRRSIYEYLNTKHVKVALV